MKINVTIDPDGSVKGDVVDGPGGAGCLKELAKLFGELGPPSKTVKTRDFYVTAKVGQKGKVSQ